MVRTLTLVDGPALKSAAICGRVARLSRLMILVSRRWSRSCTIFFRPQRCRRFDVLPDSRYSRYTREMVVDELSNKIANYFLSQGYTKESEVALLLDNCPEYVCIWLGLAKIGVITALINTNLKGDSLSHSINCINVKALIFGLNFSENVREAKKLFNNSDTIEYYCFSERGSPTKTVISFPAKSLNALLVEASSSSVDPQKHRIGIKDKMMYIYTSGTTGFPKAAIIRHRRFLLIGCIPQFLSGLHDFEVIYNPLPLYHTAGGILFISANFQFGGSMILRKKFSASNYWIEAAKHKATVGQYIGEMCRYLLNQPTCKEEKQHSIWLMTGIGIRPHVWKEFQDRFQIKHIIEAYGATEGNASLVNLFGKTGAVGFIPQIFNRLCPVSLIKVDPETQEVIRNDKGLCIRCKPGESGQLVGKILSNPINAFDGYADPEETEKKIIRDCFVKGDQAFLSGDILVMDEEGYVSFVDRTGDTFRWRCENVSTSEVENVFSKALGHASCVVFGVEIPNVEGKAGMAVIQVDPKSINLSELYQNISKRLPSYAIPLFLRISQEMEETENNIDSGVKAIYTDGSKTDEGTGSAYCILENYGIIASWQGKLDRSISVFQAEILAIRMAIEAASSLHRPIKIWADSFMAILNPKSHHSIVRKIQTLLLSHKHIHLRWLKAHVGKQRMRRPISQRNHHKRRPFLLPKPLSYLKAEIKSAALTIWQDN
ncbi:Long-chain fatty acid transport protein 1 [Araneus ventricosus]|uniref:Long-chain-fatty-acid--CoA ligase n=1 Tax=Araneus ventricosus TaxID=182803 RepID=A0A4Y2JD97_ARAVE|nr:Long-chain fatty acid transport protein 1 [Araneus ventricosus]